MKTVEEAAEEFEDLVTTEGHAYTNGYTFREAFIQGAVFQKEQDKTLAIEFAEWINVNKYSRVKSDNVLWCIGFENENYTTEQLFEKFMESKI